MVAKFHLPRDDERVVIVGSTGSGKTQAGVWQLSQRSRAADGGYTIPWYILDFKRDKLINQIPYIREVNLTDPVASEPGVYIVHPLPNETEAVEQFLWNIWGHERVGIYVDEGYMLGDSEAFRALLTQGRSKNIPIIVLSQRPVWITRFVFSEANYYQIFGLNDFRDRKSIQPFLKYDLENRLPPFYSVWYDIGADGTYVLKPVPNELTILQSFRDRLEPQENSPATAQRKIRRLRAI